MTKQEEIFSKKLIKSITTLFSLKKKTKFYKDKTKNSHSNFLKKIDKVFNPIFKIVDLNNQFSYKIIYPQKTKPYLIQIFKHTKENQLELFLEIVLYNLPKHVKSNINNIYLVLNTFKLKDNYEELLKNNIFLGKISQSLYKNSTTFLSKINKASIIYLNQLKHLYPKYVLYNEKKIHFRAKYINQQWPNFVKCLKEGISFNLTNELDPTSAPLKFYSPESQEFINNVVGIKLLENNKLLITNLEDINSSNETNHIISYKDDFTLQSNFHFLLFFIFFGYYKLPNIYAKMYKENKSVFQKYFASVE